VTLVSAADCIVAIVYITYQNSHDCMRAAKGKVNTLYSGCSEKNQPAYSSAPVDTGPCTLYGGP